ncbi:MAG: glutathione S-transferase family protein [Alphaproteobacteria bacterium]|nr:glutathione S-transferase family protein [Alphaproteobacteria bacterium]
MAMALALYHNDMSSCAQKVRLVLHEKGLDWESRHLDLRAGEHQQDWYVKLNPRAVVPTLIDGDTVVPESNVINEYLDERFPDPPLKPADAFGRARMRLWTKQLDEGVHDAGIAVLSFAVAFRHQYIAKGESGAAMLESIPDPFKRERRRDVIEKGLDSEHFRMAIERLLHLYRDMDRALADRPWLAGERYSIADAAFTPYVVRLDHLDVMGLLDSTPRVAGWYRRIQARPSFAHAIVRWENTSYLELMKRQGRENWSKIKGIADAL